MTLLESLKQDLLRLLEILGMMQRESEQAPPSTPVAPNPPSPPSPSTVYLWNNAQNARHSVRVIGDEMGFTSFQKDVICACIQQESQFNNNAIGRNKNSLGRVTSTDWGICQINDTKGWHIGVGLAFPSVEYVIAHPDKVVRYMYSMYRAGKLKLWVSYSSGAYLKYMPK